MPPRPASRPIDPIERIVQEESWRFELGLCLVRGTIWSVIGIAFLGVHFTKGLIPLSGPLIWLGTGVTFLVARPLLARIYHPALPTLLVLTDITVLGISMDLVQRALGSGPFAGPVPKHMLYGTAISLMLILTSNALRASRGTVWLSTGYAFLAWLWVSWRNDALDVLHVIDLVLFASAGAILAMAAQRTTRILLRARQTDALERFLPAPVVQRLARDPSALAMGGDEHDATVLFADLRGFTSMSSDMSPTAVVALLNEYFAEMVDEIFLSDGVLDKFIGDGICAVFPRGASGADHAEKAIRCARGMLDRLEALNARRSARGEPPLAIGVGLHSGMVLAGNIGSPRRMEYTHIGDAVNVAARMESLTKEAGAPIVASEETVRRAGGAEKVGARAAQEMSVKGKTGAIRVYGLDRRP